MSTAILGVEAYPPPGIFRTPGRVTTPLRRFRCLVLPRAIPFVDVERIILKDLDHSYFFTTSTTPVVLIAPGGCVVMLQNDNYRQLQARLWLGYGSFCCGIAILRRMIIEASCNSNATKNYGI